MNLVHSDTETDEYDPDDLPSRFSPAVIEVRRGSETEYVTVANVEETDGGHFRCIEWEGRTTRLPAWRVCEIAFLQTSFEIEDSEEANGLPREWREVAEDDRQYVPPLDTQNAVGVTEVGP